MIIQTLKLEAYFIERIAEGIARETTDEKPFIRITAELSESELFSYGNGTGVKITFDNYPYPFENEFYLDTRYAIGIKKDFYKWVVNWLEERYGDNLDYVYKVE